VKLTAFIIMGATIIASITLWAIYTGPDVTVERDGEVVCSAVCGTMYACSHKATQEDYKALQKAVEENCDEPTGEEVSYRNQDESLKHAVVIGDAEEIKKPGTEFDTCIINWEVNRETALKAFKEVCLERRF